MEAKSKMETHHKKKANKRKSKNMSLFFVGVASLLWFIFRTGTKPSRIVYPCQRAALANSSMLLSISIPLSLTVVLTKTKKFLSKEAITLTLLIVITSALITDEQFWGSLQPTGAVDPNQEIQLTLEPRNATEFPASNVYAVNGRAYAHISELINLMGSHGLLFYKSTTIGVNQGPDGLITREDVVLIKINEQWQYRGGTNTDVLKELIQAIVSHPDGFVGEIVVADNGQFTGSMDWPQSNAENISQSTQDVVDTFSPYHNVSTYRWRPIRGTRVDEYSDGDMTDGYILYDTADPETGIYVSYPKFRTQFGTYISFKYGVWNGTGYEKRLKVINIPVLKSHGVYGVTASLKHYMGVQSEGWTGGLANGHASVATGGMGTLMVETGLPTLNIIDAIWVNANPPPASEAGPSTPYNVATRVNVLIASTDPVATDYWAAKHVLVQAASLIGYDDTHTLDPDNTDKSGVSGQAFGVWLNLTKNEILAASHNVTTDENHMNVYVYAQAPLHDVAVINVVPSKAGCPGVGDGVPYPVLCQGRTAKVNVTVENQGTNSESFDVTVYANDSIIQTYAVTNLASGSQETRTVIWNTTGWAKGNYTMKAVADQVVDEIDLGDNTFIDGWIMVVHPGDLDNSGEVDITDVVMVTGIYRAKIGDPDYNACRDVVEDGEIDISDVVAVTGHYREKDP